MVMETQTKKSIFKKWWFWVVAVVVAFIVVGAMGETEPTATAPATTETSAVTKEETQPVSAPANTQEKPAQKTEAPKPSPQAAKSYQQVFTFSGNGAKKSEPFTITGERFKIAYDCSGDPSFTLCQAFVFKVSSGMPQVVMNSNAATKDETIIYGKGEYYIDANTVGNYTMTVYDYK